MTKLGVLEDTPILHKEIIMPKETPCHKDTCPFTCTENSEQAQNYGCLPSSIDILDMMVKS